MVVKSYYKTTVLASFLRPALLFLRDSFLQPLLSHRFRNYTSRAVLTLMPGPMVEAVTQLFTYWPLAAAGLALMIAPMRVLKLSFSLSAPKDTLPIGQ